MGGDHCSGPDEAVLAQIITANNGGIRSHGGSSPNVGSGVLSPAVHGTPGIDDVGEHTAWTQENVIVAGDALVDADIVLHLDLVSEDHTGRNDHVLAQIAAITHLRALHDVGEMPNLGAFSNFAPRIHHRRFVSKEFHRLKDSKFLCSDLRSASGDKPLK